MGEPEQGTSTSGRGVLDGAFHVLTTLSATPDGAGLSEVARRSGLPKTTTYRLLEQLLAVGAVHRHGQRYLIGQLITRLGEAWQPNPTLRRVALAPVRTLARMSGTAVAVTVLHGDRLGVVASTPGAVGELPWLPAGNDLLCRTAAGQTLLAVRPDIERPGAFSLLEWRRLRAGARRDSAVLLDHQEVTPGICCVALPIALGPGAGHASISALRIGRSVPTALPDLIRRAAAEITRGFAVRSAD